MPLKPGTLVWRYYHKDHLGGTTHVTDSAGDLVANRRYHPYGAVADKNGVQPTYGFVGSEIEAEEELGLVQFGARWYAPEVGRWVSGDPLFLQNPKINTLLAMQSDLFVYSSNNPMNRSDTTGTQDKPSQQQSSDSQSGYFDAGVEQQSTPQVDTSATTKAPKTSPPTPQKIEPAGPDNTITPDSDKPGARFNSPDEAAKAFGRTYNDDSIRYNREFATNIVQREDEKGKYYTYTPPMRGTKATSRSGPTRDRDIVVGNAECHGAYNRDFDSNNFSVEGANSDIAQANRNGTLRYVATPSGEMKKYDPSTRQTTTISHNMPSDPKDPDRINNKSPRVNKYDDPPRGWMDDVADCFANQSPSMIGILF